MNKRDKWLLVISAIFLISLSYSVLGFTLNFQQGAYQIIQWVTDILGPFFAVIIGTTNQLFERILLLTVILCISYLVLIRVPVFQKDGEPKTAIVWIVAIAVSILATRVVYGVDALNAFVTRLSYSVLGVAIGAAVPFIIYFFFLQTFESAAVRKILWAFYGVIFLAIWGDNYNNPYSQIYLWTAIIAFIVLLADGTIRRALYKQRMKELGEINKQERIAEIHEAMAELTEKKTKGYYSLEYYNKRMNDLKSQLKTITKL